MAQEHPVQMDCLPTKQPGRGFGYLESVVVLAALVKRRRNSGSQLLSISLVESMTRFLSYRVTPYLGSGELPCRSGGTDSVIAIYQAFDTADDPITLGLGTDGIRQRFWQAVDDPGVVADPAHSSNEKRGAHRNEIVSRIQILLHNGRVLNGWRCSPEREFLPGPLTVSLK
jgi:crotonobetainyl-CoA:carnitine CoA-transferase CaiB-like acyl-CoA transferase